MVYDHIMEIYWSFYWDFSNSKSSRLNLRHTWKKYIFAVLEFSVSRRNEDPSKDPFKKTQCDIIVM